MEPGADKTDGEKSSNEFYDVIEEELVENSSTSEDMESEEEATETSKNSAASLESETVEQRLPNVDIKNDTVNDVPSDSIKNVNKPDAPTETVENTDSKSLDDKAVPTVDTPKAEEMEVDNTDAVSETKDSDSVKDAEQRSNASNTSVDDYNDLIDDSLADEMDMSDVSSSFAENESVESKTPSPRKKPKKRQPPIMIGYRKRRKVHTKKTEDEDSKKNDDENDASEEKSQSDESRKLSEQASSASSDENIFDSSTRSTRSTRKFSGTYSEVTCADKYCWVCHKDGGNVFKCIACPRIYHPKCLTHSVLEATDDPTNFHCPECLAILKADNVNTRSPVMQTVNLDQLCTLLKHIISIMKIQKDAHYFLGPVDTNEFPHYTEYVVYPMDLSVLEKNCKNKMYGCTEAFLADVKWILHNSIVFNSKAAKITNVAKNILKICKREVAEIETCAECYYNLLVRKDTWFIEVCKKPHLLLWARLKGFPPWPAKALKFKDGMVDCRFFGAHDKAWVPLKDCYLYSKILPQPVKVKRGSNLEDGIEEIEKHIKKLKDKYGIFVYVQPRIPYAPADEEQQLRMMLPNYSPKASTSTKYLIHPDRIKGNIKPKSLFDENIAVKKPPIEETSPKDPPKEATDETEPEEKPYRKASEDMSTSTDPTSDDGTKEIPEEKPIPEQIQPTVKPIVVVSPEKAHSTDTEAEESDSSRSTVTSTKSTAGETSKTETPKEPKRKLVSVKKIETINASVPEKQVPSAATIPRTVINIVTTNKNESVVVASPITTMVSRPEPVCQIIKSADAKETVRVVKVDDKSKQKSPISVKNFASIDKCDSLISEKPPQASSLLRKDIPKGGPAPNVTMAVHDFNLDKVKDEPVDGESSHDIPVVTVSNLTPKVISTKSLLTKNQDSAFRKRPVVEEDVVEAKKSKNENNCTTVNITENVTLSLINNQATQREPIKSRPAQKMKLTKTFTLPRPTVDNTPPNEVNVNGFAAKPIRIAPAPSIPATKTLKLVSMPSRVSNGGPMNGAMPSRSNVMVVQPPRPTVKNTPVQNGVGSILDECMAECNFRKAFEETLDRIAGKGDLRAKNILLQKEMENVKRNHELVIDEIKRDYEVQIAELRAASIAQKKFDLASERLKFEQEKERAVKEAKSKQWCSNCQKSANYYCCWNTAYCDFECQKEHWNQHMHVCKNDVKKKAAESSENEPPRIMMQNDATNNYSLLNGYDKPNASYTFQSPNTGAMLRNNVTKIQMKNVGSNKNTPRPLLPRVTATVTCSPSSLSTTPVVTASFVDNSFQNGSTSITPLRSTMIGSVNVHPFIRQTQQFHK